MQVMSISSLLGSFTLQGKTQIWISFTINNDDDDDDDDDGDDYNDDFMDVVTAVVAVMIIIFIIASLLSLLYAYVYFSDDDCTCSQSTLCHLGAVRLDTRLVPPPWFHPPTAPRLSEQQQTTERLCAIHNG